LRRECDAIATRLRRDSRPTPAWRIASPDAIAAPSERPVSAARCCCCPEPAIGRSALTGHVYCEGHSPFEHFEPFAQPEQPRPAPEPAPDPDPQRLLEARLGADVVQEVWHDPSRRWATKDSSS
jgi:hypothetical protein